MGQTPFAFVLLFWRWLSSFLGGDIGPHALLPSLAEGDLSWVNPMQRAVILDEMQGAERSNGTAIARLCNAADRRNHGCDAREHPRQVALRTVCGFASRLRAYLVIGVDGSNTLHAA